MAQISGSTNNGTSACVGTCTSTGYGVEGTSSSGDGVKGSSSNSAKSGVWGSGSGGGCGVSGSANGNWPKAGVWGSNSGQGPGVYATNSGQGAALYAASSIYASAVVAVGFGVDNTALTASQVDFGGIGTYTLAVPGSGGIRLLRSSRPSMEPQTLGTSRATSSTTYSSAARSRRRRAAFSSITRSTPRTRRCVTPSSSPPR